MTVQLLRDRPGVLPPASEPTNVPQARGLAHEERMHRRFAEEFGDYYLPSPWLRYRFQEWSWRYCQPDGLLFMPQEGRILILEAKLLHTIKALPQLKRYLRVVENLFPSWELTALEVVRFYKGQGIDDFDRSVDVRLVTRPEAADPDVFNVMILGRW